MFFLLIFRSLQVPTIIQRVSPKSKSLFFLKTYSTGHDVAETDDQRAKFNRSLIQKYPSTQWVAVIKIPSYFFKLDNGVILGFPHT